MAGVDTLNQICRTALPDAACELGYDYQTYDSALVPLRDNAADSVAGPTGKAVCVDTAMTGVDVR